jgi:hypothetical protein
MDTKWGNVNWHTTDQYTPKKTGMRSDIHMSLRTTPQRSALFYLEETVVARRSVQKQSLPGKGKTASQRTLAATCQFLRSLTLLLARSNQITSYRSTHSGFILLIRSIFFLREPPLSCFSLAIAVRISEHTSKYTSLFTLNFFVNSLPIRALCSCALRLKLFVMPVSNMIIHSVPIH